MNKVLDHATLTGLMTRIDDLLSILVKTPGVDSKEYKMTQQISTWLKRTEACENEALVTEFFESSILPKLSHLAISLRARQQPKAFAAKSKILSAVQQVTANTIPADMTPALHKPLSDPNYTPAQRQKIDLLLKDLKHLLGPAL